MKLTKETLKRIIKEELNAVLDEVRIAPETPEGLTSVQLDKIHSLIMKGDQESLNTAQSFIDSFGGDPNYAVNYLEYQEVGDMEKLGNQANRAFSPEIPDFDDKARELAKSKAVRTHGKPELGDSRKNAKATDYFDTKMNNLKRYTKNKNRNKSSGTGPYTRPGDFLE